MVNIISLYHVILKNMARWYAIIRVVGLAITHVRGSEISPANYRYAILSHFYNNITLYYASRHNIDHTKRFVAKSRYKKYIIIIL